MMEYWDSGMLEFWNSGIMGKERIQKSEYRRQKGNQENWNIKYGKNGMMNSLKSYDPQITKINRIRQY
jgi:hypothetical protein